MQLNPTNRVILGGIPAGESNSIWVITKFVESKKKKRHAEATNAGNDRAGRLPNISKLEINHDNAF